MKPRILFPPSDFKFIFLLINVISYASCVFHPPFSTFSDIQNQNQDQNRPECSRSNISNTREIHIQSGSNIPPSVTLTRLNDLPFIENNDTYWYIGKDPVMINFICTAPYPIHIYCEANESPWKEETRLFYTNFTDESTYTFYTSAFIHFTTLYSGLNISCVSKPFPWLQTVVKYDHDYNLGTNFFSLIPLNSTKKYCDTKNTTINSNEDCPVIFYYEEIVDYSGFLPEETYAVYCQDQRENGNAAQGDENEKGQGGHGRWGQVAFSYCDTRGECEKQAMQVKEDYPLQYSNLFLNDKCWNKMDTGVKNCTETYCQPRVIKNFKAFIPNCLGLSKKHGHVDNEHIGSFGFFEIPRRYQARPKLVFTQETKNEDTRIFMRQFNRRQLINKYLAVKCSAISTFSIAAFQFALQFRGKNENDLEYLPVKNSSYFNPKFSVWYQTRQIELNSEDLIRIYCFVPITMETKRGFKWSWGNVSRRIDVQNPVNYFKPSATLCPSSSLSSVSASFSRPENSTSERATLNEDDDDITPPQLKITSLDPFYSLELISTVSKTNQSEWNYYPYSPTTLKIHVECWAKYPIQVVHTLQNFEQCPSPSTDSKCFQYFCSSQDFQNKSTYTFTSRQVFDITSAYEDSVIICQAVENPCLNQIVSYSRQNVSETLEVATLVLIENSAEDRGDEGNVSAGKDMVQNSSKTWDDDNDDTEIGCEVIFDFAKRYEFPYFQFWCQFVNGEKGNVSLHPCKNHADCSTLYSSKAQSKTCWKEDALKHLKTSGKEDDSVRVTSSPVFVTCVNTERGEESNLGNFAFFGIMPDYVYPPKMYPSLDDLNSDVQKNQSTVILMEEFPQIQYINGELDVFCKLSRSYLEPQFQLALEFSKKETGKRTSSDLFDENEKKTSLTFLNITEHRLAPDWTEWIKNNLYTFELERKIQFEEGQEFESLKKIYCIAGKFGSFNSVNFSRTISVGVRKTPVVEIKLLEKSSSQQATSSEKRMSQLHLTNEMTDYNFQLHSRDETIICDVFAYPPPNITWTSTSNNSLSWETIHINSSHTRSILRFEEISPSHEGVYNCSASNEYRGKTVSKTISIKVPSETSLFYLFLLIPTVALILSIVVVIRLSYRIKKLVPKEVIDKFIEGDQDENEDNPNAPIFRIPYDREKLEIDRSLVTLGEKLGSGAFGEVYKGIIDRPGSNESLVVGVKTMRSDTELKYFLAFLSEIKIMSYLEHHENVLRLIGVSTKNIEEMQVWALVEYCDLKDLEQFLQGKQKTFKCAFTAELEPERETALATIPEAGQNGYKDISTLATASKLPPDLFTVDLLKICKGICNGMNYLTEKHVVHGDLAARNVLLTSTSDENKWRVKISDFGLSRTLGRSNYVMTQDKYLPWLWMAPESLEFKKFSIESDIWSFGVVCREIFSLAEEPHYGPNVILLNYLKQGGRMTCPAYANSKIYDLMKECWSLNRMDRPPFSELCDRFSQLIHDLTEES